MFWTTSTHGFAATLCPHIGKPCPAAISMAEALGQAIDRAVAVSGPDFEITGSSEIRGCDRNCATRFFASADRIRLFCDVESDSPADPLHTAADMIFAPNLPSPIPVQALPRGTIIQAFPHSTADAGRRASPALP